MRLDGDGHDAWAAIGGIAMDGDRFRGLLLSPRRSRGLAYVGFVEYGFNRGAIDEILARSRRLVPRPRRPLTILRAYCNSPCLLQLGGCGLPPGVPRLQGCQGGSIRSGGLDGLADAVATGTAPLTLFEAIRARETERRDFRAKLEHLEGLAVEAGQELDLEEWDGADEGVTG